MQSSYIVVKSRSILAQGGESLTVSMHVEINSRPEPNYQKKCKQPNASCATTWRNGKGFPCIRGFLLIFFFLPMTKAINAMHAILRRCSIVASIKFILQKFKTFRLPCFMQQSDNSRWLAVVPTPMHLAKRRAAASPEVPEFGSSAGQEPLLITFNFTYCLTLSCFPAGHGSLQIEVTWRSESLEVDL